MKNEIRKSKNTSIMFALNTLAFIFRFFAYMLFIGSVYIAAVLADRIVGKKTR